MRVDQGRSMATETAMPVIASPPQPAPQSAGSIQATAVASEGASATPLPPEAELANTTAGAPALGPGGDGDAKAGAAPASPFAKARSGPAGLSPADAKKRLVEADGLLRAQRFAEASALYTQLTKRKQTRGRALVALAEIAFQEKNYEETIRSAKLAADRGGGVRARVLLGDAHFRLNQYQDAATAYGQALRLDPGNTSAKSGLALASKRM
jgi:tetratricopeptide (TPR) repeat protein